MNINEFGSRCVDTYKTKTAARLEKNLETVKKWLKKIDIDEIPTMEGDIISVGPYIRLRNSEDEILFLVFARVRGPGGYRIYETTVGNPNELKKAIEQIYIYIE